MDLKFIYSRLNLPKNIEESLIENLNNNNIFQNMIKYIIRHKKQLINQCWIWQGIKDKDGYGKYAGYGAHRYIWCISRNRFQEKGKMIMHTCDNRLCVNPFHLRKGTAKDNSNDMIRKGRSLVGEKHSKTIFTNNDVKQILIDLQTNTIHNIAKKHNVTETCISYIAKGKNWNHIYDSLTNIEKNKIKDQTKKNQLRNKLTEGDVKQIRKLFKKGITQTQIATYFKVQITTISNIITGKSWKHVN